MMKICLSRGITVNVLIFLWSLVFFIRLDLILTAINFDPITANIAHSCVLYMLPGVFIRCFTESLKVYLGILEYERLFSVLNIFQIFVVSHFFFYTKQVIVCSWVFIWSWQFGIQGYGVLIIAVEVVNLIFLTVGWRVSGRHREARGLGDCRNVICSKGFLNYLRFFGKSALEQYTNYLGVEIQTIIIGVTQNLDVMCAWVLTQAMSGIFVGLGEGFSEVIFLF